MQRISIYLLWLYLLCWIDVNFDLNLVAPSTFKIQLIPRFLNVNLKHELADIADADRMNWQDLALNGDQHAILE